jgi:hypothetical protein
MTGQQNSDSLIKRLYTHLETRRDKILSGQINCIPLPFYRFRSEIPGITQGTYYLVSGATKSGGLFGGSGGSGGGSSVPWAAIAKIAKEGYNGITGKEDEDYSDVEESVIYPLQGAAMGSMFGPWGALGGALYGLGYSFKDDLGMKDSNFITQITHPIGMGDGGGLRIGGKPILDLG